jgi:twitching motility protein PilT
MVCPGDADGQNMIELPALLAHLVDVGGSDLHLKVPSPPVVRVDGQLQRVPDQPPVGCGDTERILDELLADRPGKKTEFEHAREVDFSYSCPGIGRFRVSAFRQRGSISMAVRFVPASVPELEDLGLPEIVARLADEERGIVLVTGATGSGKSTTLAAMIDRINRVSSKHVVTVEDPIEVLHSDRLSIINQREVGTDTGTFEDALRRVLRQDPDVIMIGEIRDLSTVETALNAAETGHLVLSTMHTVDATETVNRTVGFFPQHQQRQVRAMLAATLKGVISQRLVRRADGSGRVAAVEVLVMTGRAEEMILNPDETGRLSEVIHEGAYYGMQTFDQALLAHVQAGRVTAEDALRAANRPQDLRLMLAQAGPPAARPAQLTPSRATELQPSQGR